MQEGRARTAIFQLSLSHTHTLARARVVLPKPSHLPKPGREHIIVVLSRTRHWSPRRRVTATLKCFEVFHLVST